MQNDRNELRFVLVWMIVVAVLFVAVTYVIRTTGAV